MLTCTVYPSICLPVYLCVFLPVYMSISLPVYPPTVLFDLYIYLHFCLTVFCLLYCLATCLPVFLTTCLPVSYLPPTRMPVSVSVCLSPYLPDCLDPAAYLPDGMLPNLCIFMLIINCPRNRIFCKYSNCQIIARLGRLFLRRSLSSGALSSCPQLPV